MLLNDWMKKKDAFASIRKKDVNSNLIKGFSLLVTAKKGNFSIFGIQIIYNE